MAISTQEAINIAQREVRELFSLEEEPRLEEFEAPNGSPHYSITLSYWDEPDMLRRYKRVRVNSSSGEVEAIRIRVFG